MKRYFAWAFAIGTLVAAGTWAGTGGIEPPPPASAHAAPLARGDKVWRDPYPSLPALDGTHHTLDEWRGSVLLVNFWASWCGPCQYEIPELVEFQERYSGRGLRIVGIGVDEERPLRNVVRSLGVNYPVLVADGAAGQQLLERFGNRPRTVPFSAVIDRSGTLVHTHLGTVDREVFDEYIAPLLDAGAADEGTQ